MIFILPACARLELASHVVKQLPITQDSSPPGYFKVGNSYKIAGKRYYPKESYNHSETGVASWYGPNFHGKQTANGEIFDKYDLTAAHRTLQMPSIVRVTNLENGRALIVRVNDRGPFSKNRVLDLSERSAELLGFKHKGTARVRIDVLPHESRQVAAIAKQGSSTRGFEIALNQKGYQPQIPETNAQAPIPQRRPSRIASLDEVLAQPASQPPQPLVKPNAYFLQAASFNNAVKARAFIERVESYGPTRINPTYVNGHKFYRVQLGPINSRSEAQEIAAQLASANIGEPFLIKE